jgi:hypothetical protein
MVMKNDANIVLPLCAFGDDVVWGLGEEEDLAHGGPP